MSGVIALDLMLHEATNSNFRNLVTRPTGAAVRDRVVNALRGEQRSQALLDFSRIGLLDFSCADEIIAKLVQVLHELPVSRVVLTGVREDHAEAIDQALGRHGLMVLALEAVTGRPRLLGEVPSDARAAFEILTRPDLGHDAASIAAHLGWQIGRARIAFDGLVTCGCAINGPGDSYDLGALA